MGPRHHAGALFATVFAYSGVAYSGGFYKGGKAMALIGQSIEARFWLSILEASLGWFLSVAKPSAKGSRSKDKKVERQRDG